jgi:hypothetical protein
MRTDAGRYRELEVGASARLHAGRIRSLSRRRAPLGSR